MGQLHKLETQVYLENNRLCDDVPTEVQALSGNVESWKITTSNSIGTPCWNFQPAAATVLDFNQQGLTGTIPSQVSG